MIGVVPRDLVGQCSSFCTSRPGGTPIKFVSPQWCLAVVFVRAPYGVFRIFIGKSFMIAPACTFVKSNSVL